MAKSENGPESGAVELDVLVHNPSDGVLLDLIENPLLAESHVLAMLERLDLSGKVIEAIARKGTWSASEAVRMRFASHPQTPRRIAVAAARQLYLFDLVRVSLLPSAPGDIRRLGEELILARTPHLTLGEKLTLARRGSARVAGALLAGGHPRVIAPALENPRLTESQILKVLAKPDAPEMVVAEISRHPKWSCQYNVRLALIRNPRTPPAALARLLPLLKWNDVEDIVAAGTLPPAARELALEELKSRSAEGAKG